MFQIKTYLLGWLELISVLLRNVQADTSQLPGLQVDKAKELQCS